MQHYGMDTSLGDTLTVALEHLQLEIGVAGCPLGYDFKKYGCLASNAWAKLLWEKVQDMNIEVKLDYKGVEPPKG